MSQILQPIYNEEVWWSVYKNYVYQNIKQNMTNCLFEYIGHQGWIQAGHNFVFIPMVSQTLHLPNHPNCTFQARFLIHPHSEYKRINLFVEIFGLKINGRQITLNKYSEMLKRFQKSINNVHGPRRLIVNEQINMIQVQFFHFLPENVWQKQFITKIWNDLKIDIVQSLFSNILYHDELTYNNLLKLKTYHIIHEREKKFREERRNPQGSKRARSLGQPKKIKSGTGSIDKIITQNLIYPMYPSTYSKFTKEIFKSVNEKTEKILKLGQEIKNKQQNPTYTKRQIKQSLYEAALCQQNKQKLEYDPNVQQNLKKYQTHTICQGINIISFPQHKCIKPKDSKSTNMSYIEEVYCQFKYVISIHNSNDLQNTGESIVKSKAESKIIEIPQDFNDMKESSSECKILMKKRSSQNQNGRMSFANEYNFIKSVRDRVFPYIARYYLETVEDKENQVQSQKQSKQKIAQKQKFIYIEPYPCTLAYYFTENLFRKLPTMRILKWLMQISSTLKYLESNKILHRDFKYMNIMIDKQGSLRFIDWGSCCYRYQKNDNGKRNNQNQLKFQQQVTKLLTTKNWSQQSQHFRLKYPQLFKRQFENDSEQFDRNYYFDIYSFGVLVNAMLDQLKIKYKSVQTQQHWLLKEIEYLKRKMLQINPFDRLGPLEILLYINELIKIQKEKSKIITKIMRNADGWIVDVD